MEDFLHNAILYYMSGPDDTSGGVPSAREIASELLEMIMGQTRKIEMAGRRVNVKPRRPAGYTYAYLDRLVGTGLTGKEWDLVFLLASRADSKGLIVYSASEVCSTLGLDPSQLHHHLRRIFAAGPLERIGRGALRLNPRMLWHGSSAAQVMLLSEQMAEEIRQGWAEEGFIP